MMCLVASRVINDVCRTLLECVRHASICVSGITYGPGGYSVEFIPTFTTIESARDIVDQLEANAWLNETSAAVVVETVLGSLGGDIYVIQEAMLEMPTSGSWITSAHAHCHAFPTYEQIETFSGWKGVAYPARPTSDGDAVRVLHDLSSARVRIADSGTCCTHLGRGSGDDLECRSTWASQHRRSILYSTCWIYFLHWCACVHLPWL